MSDLEEIVATDVNEVGSSLNSNSFCTFQVEDLLFGIEVSSVQEVIRNQPTTMVPLADSLISGLMNLRGQIVTALDLRDRFGLSPAENPEKQMNVVVRTDDGPVSLLVDKIGDVAEVKEEDFEPSPETLNEEIKELIQGAFKLENDLLLILNTNNVIQVPASN